MKISVEISYYPLIEEYKAPIKGFIAHLNQNQALVVKTNTMATQVFGEFPGSNADHYFGHVRGF